MIFKRLIINIVLIIILLNCFFPYMILATTDIVPNNNSETDKVLYKEDSETKILYKEPTINSEAGLLIEVDSGNILFDKNSTKQMNPASTTKMMTAILALENCDLDEKATVSKNAIALVPSGYTTAKLVAGEKMSIENLLYGLMLNSANEAANVIAEHISGSIEEFSKLMNEKAKEIGCTNTNFVNANGMHNENHYSTAEDLAKIAIYGMKNEEFRKIVSTVEYTLPATDVYQKNDRIMKNTNALITPSSKYFYEYAIGVKTGFTTQAGNCLVSYAEKDGINLVCVTLKAGSTTGSSSYRFADNKNLLEYGFEAFDNKDIIKKGTVIETIQVKEATNETKYLKVITKNTVSDFISNNINLSELEPKINLNSEISAPISKGQKLGTITYTINGNDYTTDLIANSNVEQNINFISYSLIAGIILLIVGIIFNFKIRHKSKRH